MKKQILLATLHTLKSIGMFGIVADSAWRRRRLLILCYHGISTEDEHVWRPGLYMEPALFESRMEMLKQGGYNVLRLGEALERLSANELPHRAVSITFDDGTFDFYARAYAVLRKYGFPVTVYQTTYYSDRRKPVFNLICSYMLWKRRGIVLDRGGELGLAQTMDLRTEQSRSDIVRQLLLNSEADDLTGEQKDELAAKLAGMLDLDYKQLLAKRLLQLMTLDEVAQLAAEGVDFQLHTHRHRTPIDEHLFRKEIQDNRSILAKTVGRPATHFCYPSGVYRSDFLPWLQAENVVSATTCDGGLATSRTNPLLLPRLVDTSARSRVEFDGWLAGVSSVLALRKPPPQVAAIAAGRTSQDFAEEPPLRRS